MAGVRLERPGRAAAPAAPARCSALETRRARGGVWIWTRFGLADPARRAAFLRRGRLSIVGESRDRKRDRVRPPRPDRGEPRRPLARSRRLRRSTDLGARPGRRGSRRVLASDAGDARRHEPAAARASRPRGAIAAAHGLHGRGRRSAGRARLRRVGRARRFATSRPDEWARVARRPDVRAAGWRVARRGDGARRRLLRASSSADELVVAVSHVSPIKAAVCWALGVDERARGGCSSTSRRSPRIGARGDGRRYLAVATTRRRRTTTRRGAVSRR